MADPELLRSLDIAGLEAEAAVARDEDDAAADLALSLRQGSSFYDTLRRWGCFDVSLDQSGFCRCSELAQDFVRIGAGPLTIVPIQRIAVARPSEGPDVLVSTRDLLSVLRDQARRGAWLQVERAGGHSPAYGALLQVSPDHVILRTSVGELAIRLGSIDAIRAMDAPGPGGGAP